jgi:hypothetical protein
MKIDETPHYRSLYYGTADYEEYYKKYRYKYLLSDHYYNKFMRMSRLRDVAIKDFDPVLIMQAGDLYQILDGVHRAAVALFNEAKDLRCVELS